MRTVKEPTDAKSVSFRSDTGYNDCIMEVFSHLSKSLSTTMAPSRWGQSRSSTIYLAMLTLLLSGDIELCPGSAMDCGSNPSFSHKLFNQNATSIVGKLQDFNVYFSDLAYDFITTAETWLWEDMFDNEVLSDSYIYRRNRDSTVVAKNKKCHGGGALIAVSSTYCSIRRLDLETDWEIL